MTSHAKGPWPVLTGYYGTGCLACNIETSIGTEENPHPVPQHFHTCTAPAPGPRTPPDRIGDEPDEWDDPAERGSLASPRPEGGAPHLVDRADGVRGHFCVCRVVDGVRWAWGPKGWAAVGTVFSEEQAMAVLAALAALVAEVEALAEEWERIAIQTANLPAGADYETVGKMLAGIACREHAKRLLVLLAHHGGKR
jgi:hypothetical protein